MILSHLLSRLAMQEFQRLHLPVHQYIHEWETKYRTSRPYRTLDLCLLDLTYVWLLCMVSNADTRVNSPVFPAWNHAACRFSDEKLRG